MPSETSVDSQQTPETPLPWWSKLPPWVTANVQSKKSLKVLFRCWLASWVAFILMLPQNSLTVMGNACVIVTHRPSAVFTSLHAPLYVSAFFALLTSVFLPPNIPIQVFIFVSLSSLTFPMRLLDFIRLIRLSRPCSSVSCWAGVLVQRA